MRSNTGWDDQPFLDRSHERKITEISEKMVVRKSRASKAEAKNAGSANIDAFDTRTPIAAGKVSSALRILSKNTLHTLEHPSLTILSSFSRTGS